MTSRTAATKDGSRHGISPTTHPRLIWLSLSLYCCISN